MLWVSGMVQQVEGKVLAAVPDSLLWSLGPMWEKKRTDSSTRMWSIYMCTHTRSNK